MESYGDDGWEDKVEAEQVLREGLILRTGADEMCAERLFISIVYETFSKTSYPLPLKGVEIRILQPMQNR